MFFFQLIIFFFWESFLFNHPLKLVDMNRISINHGHYFRAFDLSHLDINKRKPFFFDLLAKVLKKAFPFFLIGLHDFFFQVDIFLAFKKLWNLVLKGLYKVPDVLFKRGSFSRLKTKQSRRFRVFKTVYIAKIVRHIILFGYLLE